jgi:multidrug efflux pump subunit AcrB
VYIKNRLRVMRDSALLGGILVVASLILFLNLRFAGMTALGIPVSFLGCLLMAHALGITMSMITMFALIIVLGMVVDDAIVVGENVYRHIEEGLSPWRAAIEGTAEVGKPVVATILTTVVAFLPVLMIGGTMGAFMKPLPIIVSLCLLASLLEALCVLPAHLAHWSGRSVRPRAEGAGRWYDALRDLYARWLEGALRWRYLSLTIAGTLILLLIGVARYRIPFVLFDDFESKVFSVNLRLASGASVEQSYRVAQEIEDQIAELPPEELESTNLIAGVSYQDASRYSIAQNVAQVWVELREGGGRERTTAAIIEDLRRRFVPPPAGVETLEITQPQAGPTGRAIDIAVLGKELDVLRGIAAELKADLAGFRGVRDVRDNAESGKREVRVRLNESGRLLGFDERSLAAELRASFEGTRYARVRRGEDDVEIVVKLPEELRFERGLLQRLLVAPPASATGGATGAGPLPLGSIAELYEDTGPAVISRDEGERSIRVSADVNKQEGNTADITRALSARYRDLGARHPGYGLEFRGEHEDTVESFAGLGTAMLLAVFLVYMILGSLFRSFTQPLVVMTAIPFGAVGMVLGHLAMGRSLSFLSLIGFVALGGIVVNDSLILQDFINCRRREGMPLFRAVVTAGRQRFRPILLTSITTMLGLSPLTFFASGQARFLQPMAITIFYGLAASTFLILLVVPCAYVVHEDLAALLRHPLRSLRALRGGGSLHGPPREGAAAAETT